MAVCIPTYMLASYMMRAGLSWQAAVTIIGLANLVITIPDDARVQLPTGVLSIIR